MHRPSRLHRLARWCATHRLPTATAWLVAVVLVSLAASAAGTEPSSATRLPGTESQRVADLLAAHAPAAGGDADQVVFAARSGTLRDPAARASVARAVDRLRAVPVVASVADPLRASAAATVRGGAAATGRDASAGGGAVATSGRVTADGRIAVADVVYRTPVDELSVAELDAVERAAFGARSAAVRIEHGGAGAELLRAETAGGGSAELVGLTAAAVVLLLTFGSLAAAGMPLVTALLALAGSLGAIGLLSHVMDTPDFASQLASLIGIGVGIDYALFVITRYRTEIGAGRDRLDAIAVAADTAGRTVLHAGATVIVALLGLLLLGLPLLHGVAVGSALAVAATVVATLTLLPALLATAGRFAEPRRTRSPASADRAAAGRADGGAGHADGAGWERWAAAVQRRPWVAATAALALLLALCAPVAGMRLGAGDASVAPADSTSFKAQALVAEGFGPGADGPFLLAAELPTRGDRAAADAVASAVGQAEGIADVGTPELSPDGAVATFAAVPTTGLQDARTTATLERLREDVLPRVRRETGVRTGVGGQAAAVQDSTRAIADKLPLFVGAVVVLSALMLLVLFRSVAIPLKAALMNLLGIGAALGVVTAIFRDGPIEPFVPVLAFAVVFGLSMDYEIFLLSRVRDEWRASGDSSVAVRRALAGTGRVITAAAAIMVVVFASFVLGGDRVMQQFGVALATAVLVDAVVIRCVLVPAVMALLGDRAWWLPRLRRPGRAPARAG